MGHAKDTTTLGVYAHVLNTDDHADAMAALGAMDAGPSHRNDVVPLWGGHQRKATTGSLCAAGVRVPARSYRSNPLASEGASRTTATLVALAVAKNHV